MQLPQDKESLELLVEELEAFKRTRVYHLFQEKLSALLRQAGTLCQETDYPQVYRHQGQSAAYRKVANLTDDIIGEVRRNI